MKGLFLDLFVLVVLVTIAYFLLQNFEYSKTATSDNYQWSGDDTLKVMFVKDSAYIVR